MAASFNYIFELHIFEILKSDGSVVSILSAISRSASITPASIHSSRRRRRRVVAEQRPSSAILS